MNLLAVPSKASLPCDIAASLREHISTHFKDAHPDQFKADYDVLRKLRTALTVKPGSKQEIHSSLLHQSITYHAQLVFLLNKFPADVGASFAWLPVFANSSTSASLSSSLPGMMPTTSPITLADLNYERAAILFNIAAMHASLGAAESRAEQESIKRALAHFQHAAGCFALLSADIVKLVRTAPGEPTPVSPDFSTEALAALEHLCLAQAQECFWQKAVLDHLKNGTIAKLAARVSELYGLALENAQKAKGAGGTWPTFAFPSELINQMTIKKAHFTAAAQYRKSCDDLGANKYGDEVGRLRAADSALKEASAVSRKGVAASVLDDMKGLQATVADNLARAVRDNDLIYLDPVPTPARLAVIQPASMTQATVPPAVAKPLDYLHDSTGGLGRPVFETLVPYAVHQALSVYSDRVETLIRTEVAARVEELNALAASTLQSIGLPGSIQALEAPISLPPTLLRKAAEVRAESGPSRLRSMLNDVSRLAASNAASLEASKKLLDTEEGEDAKERAAKGSAWTRPPSSQANAQLRAREQQLAQTFQQARSSDALVRQKYVDGERRFTELAMPESELQHLVPSSSSSISRTGRDPNPRQTTAVRQLRRRLENLDDLAAARAALLSDARRLAAADDVRPAVLRSATAHDVTAAAFEPLFEKELAKYGRFEDEVSENAQRQEDELEAVRTVNEAFLEARRDDATLHQREVVLQELDAAYHRYRELTSNLAEGLRFYNELSRLLADHQNACHEWVRARRREAQDNLAAQTANLSLGQSQPSPNRPWHPSEGIRFS